MIFLEKHFGADLKKEFSVLDFAPTLSFSKKMRSFKNVKYTSTDISRDDVDVRMDVENMSTIKDNAFDVIIFSHVLEHVSSPPKALSELHRVLSPDGVAIIMVPLFHSVETTLEAKGETSVEERLRLYGQDDHVRLYAKKDFLAALQGANFKVAQKRPTDFDPTLIAKNAIADDSVLYLCKR